MPQLKTISLKELFQVSYPCSRIAFTTPGRGRATLEVRDEFGKRVTTLLDATLPAGEYRVHWDYLDGDGRKRPTKAAYSFALTHDGQPIRSGKLQPPKAVWR